MIAVGVSCDPHTRVEWRLGEEVQELDNSAMDQLQTPPLLIGRRLTKTYRAVTALRAVDFHLHRGDAVAVMGPSGAGKSTLLLTLAGIVRPDQGAVSFNGVDLRGLSDAGRARIRRDHFGFVFQDAQLVPELSARDNVALALLVRGVSSGPARQQADQMLERVGFRSSPTMRCYNLSGGEAQLVSIARALVGQPDVIFADEPTGALDQASGQQVMSLLVGQSRATGAALVIVTHDPRVANWCGEVITIEDGSVRSRHCNTHSSGATSPTSRSYPQETAGAPVERVVAAGAAGEDS